jgi:hypothetical protein
MLKKNYFNLFLLFFIGIMIIYTTNVPPTVIIKYPKIDSMSNVHFFGEK